jgi:hypothetical protein
MPTPLLLVMIKAKYNYGKERLDAMITDPI